MFCSVVFDVPLDRDFDYAIPSDLLGKVKPGVRVTAPFGRMLTTGLVVKVSPTTSFANLNQLKEIACVLDERPVFGSDLFFLADFMKKNWGGPIGQILFALVPPQAYFKLGQAAPLPSLQLPSVAALKDEQQAVFADLNACLNNGFHHILLSGNDSRGKTDIVLRLARQTLAGYGQALLTLPDVLAAQNFAKSIASLFPPDTVFCWHSRMLLSQKKKIFSRVCHGLPCVIVSARSGGLLPFKNLRLAAMLEEENDNYKQEENKPYFHLRDVLLCRTQQHEALFVSVSDTPSLETLFAVKQGSCRQYRLSLPKDGRFALQYKVTGKKGEHSALFSDFLLDQLKDNLQNKQASLIILNRRGYANAYYCLNCGAYAKCKKCGAILAREKTKDGEDILVCKKCGHKESLQQTCPQCQNKIFKSRGGGTQKIVSEINKLFPQARVLRLDGDTLKNKDGQGHLVRLALDRKEADIVVGTRQSLEAALSPQVTLCAVADADLELDSPDFRASEKFGQLLFKLKNRLCTRPGGRLIIQTSSADIYPFEALASDYISCAREEMLAREGFAYPPFVQMVKLLIKSKDGTLLNAETARVMSAAAPFCTEALGPVKTGKKTDTLKKQYLLFKTTPEKYAALVHALDRLVPSKKTEFKLTADPYDFY